MAEPLQGQEQEPLVDEQGEPLPGVTAQQLQDAQLERDLERLGQDSPEAAPE